MFSGTCTPTESIGSEKANSFAKLLGCRASRFHTFHQVSQQTQQAVSSRVQSIDNNAERVVRLSKEFFAAFNQVASDLAAYVEHDGDTEEPCSILGRMAVLSISTTGNGNYLLEKGHLVL